MSFATSFTCFEANIVSIGFKGDSDPVKRFNDNAVLNFTVARNNRRGKDANGEWVDIEPAEFTRCTVWGDAAENVAKLNPGDPVIIYGSYRSKDGYTTKDGEERGPSEILNVSGIGVSVMRHSATSNREKGGASRKSSANKSTTRKENTKPDTSVDEDVDLGFDDSFDDDDLPF